MLFSDTDKKPHLAEHNLVRLNPCCNGCCSLTVHPFKTEKDVKHGLNPCCNGCCSLTSPMFMLCESKRESQSLL